MPRQREAQTTPGRAGVGPAQCGSWASVAHLPRGLTTFSHRTGISSYTGLSLQTQGPHRQAPAWALWTPKPTQHSCAGRLRYLSTQTPLHP